MQTEAKNIVIQALEELKERIAANIEASGQTASGRTAQSMHVEASENGAALFGRRAFGTLETGRKGGKVPQNFRSIIRQWILDKGISVTPIPYIRKPSNSWQPKYTPQERGEMSLAGAIAHKIQNEGTALQRSGGRNDIYSQEIPKTLAAIKGKIMPLMVAEIRQVIKIN
jgi:hypothetical protein